jgi:2-polyprenyl-3-methyl-5-hydroxy-6-metoxy-1,4-benzoquinol methylase
MLALEASDLELHAAADALRQLHEAHSDQFQLLFESPGPHVLRDRDLVPAPLLASLAAVGLVDGDDELRGCRLRCHGGRFFALDVGDSVEYFQDEWPETDALVAYLASQPAGRLLDLGTGCGLIAIAAAAAGFDVVATDLYEVTCRLARWNARLNRVRLDVRAGDLYTPVDGEKFDRVVSNIHYGRGADPLRFQVLRGAPAHLAPGGRLALASVFEWQRPGRLAIESVLDELARSGHQATVRPILSERYRSWFGVATADEPLGPLVSRQRFLVELRAPDAIADQATVTVEWPAPGEIPERPHVSLARLLGGAATADAGTGPRFAVVHHERDVAALATLAEGLAAGRVQLERPLGALLDACRFGAEPCVGTPGAAAGILDEEGGVRPCTHGARIADSHATVASVAARLRDLAAAAEERRGCRACPASPVCSRCLFPVPLDEGRYCDWVRARAAVLPALHRLFRLDGALRRVAPSGTILVETGPGVAPSSETAPELVRRLAAAWTRERVWIAERSGLRWLCRERYQRPLLDELDELSSTVLRALRDRGAAALTPEQLRLPARIVDRTLARLAHCLDA